MPLGYDVRDRKLIINEPEAATVRMIFKRFVAIGSATKLAKALVAEGVRTKSGRPVDKGYIYRLLNSRVYLGERQPHQWLREHFARTSLAFPDMLLVIVLRRPTPAKSTPKSPSAVAEHRRWLRNCGVLGRGGTARMRLLSEQWRLRLPIPTRQATRAPCSVAAWDRSRCAD